jgi:hypothetical protein
VTDGEIHTGLIFGETFDGRPLQYTVVDGFAIFEGDIILGLDEDLQRGVEDMQEETAHPLRSPLRRSRPKAPSRTWTGISTTTGLRRLQRIPGELVFRLSRDARGLVARAADQRQSKVTMTCVG